MTAKPMKTLELHYPMIQFLIKGFIWCKQGAVAPKRTWGPLIFISQFKFLQYKQSIGEV